jgi:hypothetical protein
MNACLKKLLKFAKETLRKEKYILELMNKNYKWQIGNRIEV